MNKIIVFVGTVLSLSTNLTFADLIVGTIHCTYVSGGVQGVTYRGIVPRSPTTFVCQYTCTGVQSLRHRRWCGQAHPETELSSAGITYLWGLNPKDTFPNQDSLCPLAKPNVSMPQESILISDSNGLPDEQLCRNFIASGGAMQQCTRINYRLEIVDTRLFCSSPGNYIREPLVGPRLERPVWLDRYPAREDSSDESNLEGLYDDSDVSDFSLPEID